MVSRKLAVTGTVAACAACCAPLVVPLVWPMLVAAGLVGAGSAGGGWLAGLNGEAILCGGIAFAVLAGGAVWFWQRNRRTRASVPDISEGSECSLDTCGPVGRGAAEG
jgi:membrane protein implicated in regulation of membrane protease activity